LISAVGQLNLPREPDIPGLKEFQGKMMHSARWDWSYNLKGKRIAIIGNGTHRMFMKKQIYIAHAK
jgi:cation diffusion facilitator CzcD-associated flavoprotein CzcO